MIPKLNRNAVRRRVHARIRQKVHGTPERPRLNVYRSLHHIYAQIIDDNQGLTLVSASTVAHPEEGTRRRGGNVEAAREVGRLVAERATAQGIRQVAFDRGGYLYHGRIKALADAAREAGLDF